MLADQCVIVAGEFKTRRLEDFEVVGKANADALVRQVLRDTGYNSAKLESTPMPARFRFASMGSQQILTKVSIAVMGAGCWRPRAHVRLRMR